MDYAHSLTISSGEKRDDWALRMKGTSARRAQYPVSPHPDGPRQRVSKHFLVRPVLTLIFSPSYIPSSMKVVSTFHHPSAVTCSAKCKFVPDNREYLVVGKTNNLELYSLQPKGLHLESTLDVWAHVIAIRPVEFSVRPTPSPLEPCAQS